MKEIGEHLKNRRTQLGISLDKAEQDLKIRKKYLIALEEGNEDALPGKTYFIGYLRNYSNYLQLEPGLINQKINKSEQVAKTVEIEPRTKRKKTNKYISKMKRKLHLKKDKISLNVISSLKIVMIIFLIAGFGFIINQFVHRLGQPDRIIQITESDAPSVEKTVEQEMIEIAQEKIEKEGPTGVEAIVEELALPEPLPDYEPIEITADEPGWVKITQNEHILFEGVVTSTENISVKTDGEISLTTSRPNRMTVSYNDETLEPEPLENYRLLVYHILPSSSKN